VILALLTVAPVSIWASVVATPPLAPLCSTRDAVTARDAFLVAFPVFTMAQTRARSVVTAEASGSTAINRFRHRARLASHGDRAVTTPNNDTLISSGWLDLAKSPVVLSIPALPSRYHSVALMNIHSDNFAVLSNRSSAVNNKNTSAKYLLVGLAWRGIVPSGHQLIRAPGNDIWALARILVDGQADLAAATAAQQLFVIEEYKVGNIENKNVKKQLPTQFPIAPGLVEDTSNPVAFLATVNTMLARNPVPAKFIDSACMRKLAAFGVGIRPTVTLTPEQASNWRQNMPTWRAELVGGFFAAGTTKNGWSYPWPGMGNFGRQHFYRAVVAQGGLAALPATEAVYFTAMTDNTSAPLDGTRPATLRVPAMIPMNDNGFWSVSMYEVTADGRRFFVENPIKRYAIGDRTPSLVRDTDGSVTLLLQTGAPASTEDGNAPIGNWLPTPAGRYELVFRIYRPKHIAQQNHWLIPAVATAKLPTN
jgi:hypothetical protein